MVKLILLSLLIVLSGCTKETELLSESLEGTWSTACTQASGGLGLIITVKFSGSSFTCGLSNWAVGVAQNITGLLCAGEQTYAAGDKDHDIYFISNMDFPGYFEMGALYFGYNDSSHDGTSDATRPTSLGSRTFYRK